MINYSNEENSSATEKVVVQLRKMKCRWGERSAAEEKLSPKRRLLLKRAAATYSPAIRSTIGADGLNFSVLKCKISDPDTITTIIS